MDALSDVAGRIGQIDDLIYGVVGIKFTTALGAIAAVGFILLFVKSLKQAARVPRLEARIASLEATLQELAGRNGKDHGGFVSELSDLRDTARTLEADIKTLYNYDAHREMMGQYRDNDIRALQAKTDALQR